MKRAFVTGGSGFLGRALIGALAEKRIEVRALARSETAANAVRAAGTGAEITVVRGDLDATDVMAAGMEGCDVVFHSAALADEYGPMPTFVAANVTGTENALAAAVRAHVSRFVHVSTEAVLADGHPIVNADETRPYPASPVGPYPITKGAAERAVLAASTRSLTTVAIRPRFIWGRGDSSLLPKFVQAVKSGRFAWIGGGRYLTSTCHVANVCEGALRAAEVGVGGQAYFLTDGAPVEFREFMTRYLATQGVDASKCREVPRWVASTVAGLLGWLPTPPVSKTALAVMGHEVTVSDAKARRDLGYVGAITVEAGIAAM